MTEQEFIEQYCNGRMSIEKFNARYIALPCHCGDPSCRGWAAVTNNHSSITEHISHERVMIDIAEMESDDRG